MMPRKLEAGATPQYPTWESNPVLRLERASSSPVDERGTNKRWEAEQELHSFCISQTEGGTRCHWVPILSATKGDRTPIPHRDRVVAFPIRPPPHNVARGLRTHTILVNSQVLYQLS